MDDTRKARFVGCMSVMLALGFPVVTAQDASKDGWKSLFNGKDLAGWRIANDGDFKVEDGAIVVRGARAYLFTEEQFDHFDFRCEVMTEPVQRTLKLSLGNTSSGYGGAASKS